MKTILIPTDYQDDTIHALESTWRKGSEPTRIILLALSPIPDSITDLLFLPSGDGNSAGKKQLLEEWELRRSLLNLPIAVTTHHQYGASFPLLEQIMERFQVDSVIIPHSIQVSDEPVHVQAMQSFQKMKMDITLIPESQYSYTLN